MLRGLFLKPPLLPIPRVKTLPGGLSAMWKFRRLQTLSPLHAELYDVSVPVHSGPVWPSHSRRWGGRNTRREGSDSQHRTIPSSEVA